jgi:hypothetical protein
MSSLLLTYLHTNGLLLHATQASDQYHKPTSNERTLYARTEYYWWAYPGRVYRYMMPCIQSFQDLWRHEDTVTMSMLVEAMVG